MRVLDIVENYRNINEELERLETVNLTYSNQDLNTAINNTRNSLHIVYANLKNAYVEFMTQHTSELILKIFLYSDIMDLILKFIISNALDLDCDISNSYVEFISEKSTGISNVILLHPTVVELIVQFILS